MKIKFQITGFETLEDNFKHYNYRDKNNPLYSIFQEITNLLNKKNLEFIPHVNIKDQESLTINIKLTDKTELLKHFVDEQSFGCFCLTEGDGHFGKKEYAKDFNTIILINTNTYKDIFKMYQERNKHIDGKSLQKSYLNSYLNTLTHEVTHAIEFIENSGGLTPYQIDKMYKNKESKVNVEKCATGYGFEKYKNDFVTAKNKNDVYDLMEYRVEKKGRELLDSLPIDLFLIEKTINNLNNTNAKNRPKI
jgi:hypothetical protein